MKTFSYLMAVLGVAVFAIFVVVNWTTLMTPAPVDLLVAQVSAPLGILMLGLTAVLFVVFMLAYLGNQVGAMLEMRSLRKEVQRAQQLADQAEQSRVEGLREFIGAQFQALNTRLDKGTLLVEPVTSASGIRQPSLVDLVTGRGA